MYRVQYCENGYTSFGEGFYEAHLGSPTKMVLKGYYYATRRQCKVERLPIWSRPEHEYNCQGDQVAFKIWQEEVSLGRVKSHSECKALWDAVVQGIRNTVPPDPNDG